MKRLLPLVIAVVAVLGAGAWYFNQGGARDSAGFDLPGSAEAQGADVDTSTVQEMVLGNPDAAVEVIEYASYTCPHCASFHAGAYKQLKSDYIDTGKIKFVYREVYFDKYGMWASMIARCEPSKFFGITDLLYKGQRDWARADSEAGIADNLRKIGLLAGLDKDQLDACLSDGTKLRALVAWFQKNAEADGINSTPSFVINGSKYANMPYDEMKGIIDAAMGG